MEENKKPTLLESYKAQKDYATECMKGSQPTAQNVWFFQELLYRINTLEIFQAFLMAAPYSVDPKPLIPHFQLFEAYILCLMNERKIGRTDNKEIIEQQKTAFSSLELVYKENKKKFGNYAPRSNEQYHIDIELFTNTILPAWIQYRNTLIDLNTKPKEDK